MYLAVVYLYGTSKMHEKGNKWIDRECQKNNWFIVNILG